MDVIQRRRATHLFARFALVPLALALLVAAFAPGQAAAIGGVCVEAKEPPLGNATLCTP